MSSFDAIKAKAKPLRSEVTIPLDGATFAEIKQVTEERNALLGEIAGIADESLAVSEEKAALLGRAEALADRLTELGELTRESEQTFVLQSVGERAWSRVISESPPRDGVREDYDASVAHPRLMALSLADPKLSEAEVVELADILSAGQWEILWMTCLMVNRGSIDRDALPKSVRR